MRRRRKLVKIDFDWENAPSFQRPHPDDDPILRPLFGGVLQSKFLAPAMIIGGLFTALITWHSLIAGTTPQTEVYFFALQNRAANVCIDEPEYVGDSYAIVPVVWKSVTGETAAAHVQLERSATMISVGDRWTLDEVAYSSMESCESGVWQQTAWSTGLKVTPTVPSQATPDKPGSSGSEEDVTGPGPSRATGTPPAVGL